MTARGSLILAFAVLTAGALALEFLGRAHRSGLVPMREVIAQASSSLPGRVALALVWAWLGWHLLAR